MITFPYMQDMHVFSIMEMTFETDMNSDLSTKQLSIKCRNFKNTGNNCASIT